MSKCIFITSVEKKEADYPVLQVAKDVHPTPFDLYPKSNPEKEEVYFETETIKARKFKNGSGNTIYIGLCKEAQDSIGVWLESFENLQKAYHDLHNKYIGEHRKHIYDLTSFKESLSEIRDKFWKQYNELKFYRNMNFWQRLRFLFKIW